MKANSVQRIIASVFCAAILFLSGCYTVLMSPSAMISSESGSAAQGYVHNNSSDISYSDNCLSCHSQAELDDRYYDMQKAGMVSAHGISIDRNGSQAPSTGLPWWYEEITPVPPTAISASSSVPDSAAGPRRRTTGSTRGGDGRSLSDSGTEALAPAPATAATTPNALPPPPPAAVARERATTDQTRTSGNTSTQVTPQERKPD